MKNCRMCKKYKRAISFHWRSQVKGTRQTICKNCWSVYHRKHYLANKSKYILNAAKNREFLVQEINRIKEASPCKDCKQKYPAYVMDFDHITGKKIKDVAILVRGGNRTKLFEEIAKCDLVCANCHRIRTHSFREYDVMVA